MFMTWICWGILTHLESWSTMLTWHVVLSCIFFTTRVIFVHLVLWVDLVVDCTEENIYVLVWLEQRC